MHDKGEPLLEILDKFLDFLGWTRSERGGMIALAH
jgi:hypothetical protein